MAMRPSGVGKPSLRSWCLGRLIADAVVEVMKSRGKSVMSSGKSMFKDPDLSEEQVQRPKLSPLIVLHLLVSLTVRFDL